MTNETVIVVPEKCREKVEKLIPSSERRLSEVKSGRLEMVVESNSELLTKLSEDCPDVVILGRIDG